ncbi:MAG: orotidine-5'-phosphate decarboxylase [bacterium]
MNQQQLFEQILKKRSYLCIGLDTDLTKIPKHLLELDDPMFEFNKAIIDATHHLAIAYKPNLAFYEAEGSKGWASFEKTVKYIKDNYPEIFVIADAKRGDIGNTSNLYARAFFEKLPCDATTVAPYMGEDSVAPFLSFPGKWVILLDLTSNKGSSNFQHIVNAETGKELYQEVLIQSQSWGTEDNMMYVVGATQATKLAEIRQIVPNHFLLVPGVGAQGGSLEEVAKYGMTKECGLIVNSSRNIIYASNGPDFAEAAARAALTECQQPMEQSLHKKGLL